MLQSSVTKHPTLRDDQRIMNYFVFRTIYRKVLSKLPTRKLFRTILLFSLLLVIITLLNEQPFTLRQKLKICDYKMMSFVYIKMFKCASETLSTVFRRFGLKNNLSFMTPLEKRWYIGWPHPPNDNLFRPALRTGGFHIALDHMVYKEDFLHHNMRPEALYITSLREPFSQFRSLFLYYNLQNIIGLHSSNPVGQYLRNVKYFDDIYQKTSSSKIRYCVPDNFSMTRDIMSHTLGWNRDLPYTDSKINAFIKYIENKFNLVLIVEHWQESMVLLKRLMCWKFKDIIYLRHNQAKNNYSNQNIPVKEEPELRRIYAKWSPVDHVLYRKFNETLWKKIKSLENDFIDEVDTFRQLLQLVQYYCLKISLRSVRRNKILLNMTLTRWDETFTLSEEDCEKMRSDNRDAVVKRYEMEFRKTSTNPIGELTRTTYKPIPDFC